MENPDGTIAHAELTHGTGMIMLGSVAPPETSAYSQVAPPPGASSIYVVIEDTDAHHARAVAAGAQVVMAPVDQDYGSREYTARDPEGNLWTFGTYDPWTVAG